MEQSSHSADFVQQLRALPRLLEDAFADWAHRFILRQHQPVDVGDGVVCANHWGRALPWPCPDVVREMHRWDRRHAAR